MGDAPNRLETVKAVDAQYPYLLVNNSHQACGEFVQRCLYAMNGNSVPSGAAAEWRHISKNDGESGVVLPNGQRVSHDVIWHSPTKRQIDIIAAGGADPAPGTGVRPPGGPTWSEIDPSLYRPHNVAVGPWAVWAVIPPSEVVAKRARLARGLFWFLRGLKDHNANTREQWAWLMTEETPEIIRVFLDLEGESHTSGGTLPDPWELGGIDGRDPQWPALFNEMLDLGLASGVKFHCTLYGGCNHYRTLDERRRFNDQIVQNIGSKWAAIYGFHIANEFNVNGFSEKDVQDAGADLFSKVPKDKGLHLSLSSPAGSHVGVATNEEMQESFEALYGTDYAHYGANCIDVHLVRDQSDRWAQAATYNFILPELMKGDHEPFGQYSSVWWTSDPATIINGYKLTSDAGWAHYVAHSCHSAWGGLIPKGTVDHLRRSYGDAYADAHMIRNIWDMPNQKAISNGLRDYRAGGVAPEIPAGGGGESAPSAPVKKSALYAHESLLPEQSLYSPGGAADLHYQSDGNLVAYLDGQPVWTSNTEGETCGSLQMQPDGNLVLYNKDQAIRATRTDGHPGAMVQMQDDGNFVVYSSPTGPNAGTPLWASATDTFYGPEE